MPTLVRTEIQYLIVKTGTQGPSGSVTPISDNVPLVKGSTDDTKQLRFEVDGLTTSTTRVVTIPDSDVDLGLLGPHVAATEEVHGLAASSAVVGTDDTQTLTNKTLTSPVIDATGTDAEGDIYYRKSDGTLERLAKGTEGFVLTSGAAVPAWSAAASTPLDVRQTILTGSVDADGYADFLSAGTGLAVDLAATGDNVLVAFAAGMGTAGNIDYIGVLSADVSSYWSSLTANATNYPYFDRNVSTGAITAGFTVNLPPIYGTTYNKSGGVGKSLLHFTGADSSTTITDENSSITWTAQGLADIQSNQLNLANATDYATQTGLTFHAGEKEGGFSLETKIYLDSVGATQHIFSCATANHFELYVNATGNLVLSLGDGSTWTISNATAGTATLSAATTYWVKFQHDGSAYKVYYGTSGTTTEDISVTSSVAFAATTDELRLGHATTSLIGNMDEVRYNVGPQTNTAPTVPTADYKGLAMDGEPFFNRTIDKMTFWNDTTGSWDVKQRVFAGEVITNGSSVTNVITYALKGEYDSGRFTIATNTLYEKDHNIGCTPEKFTALGAEGESYGLKEFTNIDSNTTSVRLGAWVEDTLRNSINLYTGITGAYVGQTVQVATQARIRASRGW